jgi:propanediol dehydratase large subunit
MLDKELTPYDIVTILRCLNDARKVRDRLGAEHYVENVNLEAFALQFATDAATRNLEVQDKLESDMAAEVARQFSPASVNVGVTVGVAGIGTTTTGEASQ